MLVWDVRNAGKALFNLSDVHGDDVLSVSFAGKRLASAGEDGSVAVFDFSRGGSELEMLANTERALRAVGFGASDQLFYETLDNVLGALAIESGARAFVHRFENSDTDKRVYLIKSVFSRSALTSAFSALSVDGDCIRRWAVKSKGLSRKATYRGRWKGEVRDCETVGNALALVTSVGDVVLARRVRTLINKV